MSDYGHSAFEHTMDGFVMHLFQDEKEYHQWVRGAMGVFHYRTVGYRGKLTEDQIARVQAERDIPAIRHRRGL